MHRTEGQQWHNLTKAHNEEETLDIEISRDILRLYNRNKDISIYEDLNT